MRKEMILIICVSVFLAGSLGYASGESILISIQ
ncbi:Uncharacterised protein [Yersinia pekkanenii]|uniref:Uncharacterized protein n=1 Tax=Yersinia pekkanenii TaxID=1288385 RepID=A0A0T9P954_9GAMM|nr:Uncharacterised protein [Yersinia pekkanenii]CRY67839.1 Uncharacterised protein [Yersinia pekkanenii]